MSEPRVELDRDGALVMRDDKGWAEPVCTACFKPIQWVLDMASFTHDAERGGYSYQHARCAWKPEAFRRQERLSKARHSS